MCAHKSRGIICKAALISAPGMGPNIGDTNLLPPWRSLCHSRQMILRLWQPVWIFSFLLLKDQLQLPRYFMESSDCPHLLCGLLDGYSNKGTFSPPRPGDTCPPARLFLEAAAPCCTRFQISEEPCPSSGDLQHKPPLPTSSKFLSLHKINFPILHHCPG